MTDQEKKPKHKRKQFDEFELKHEYTQVESVTMVPVKQRPTYKGIRTKTISPKGKAK